MSSNTTLDAVKETMADVFDLEDLSVTATTTAEDIEEWDSLSNIRLVVAIERRFNVKFKNSEITSLQNVGDLIRLIEAKAH